MARRKTRGRVVRGRNLSSRNVVVNPSGPFPDALYTKMKYSDIITLTSTSGLTNYQFRTSLFDPDLTSTGHQPKYRDELAGIYNRYVVFGVAWKIRFVNTNTAEQAVVGIKWTSDTTVYASIDDLTESHNTKHAILGVEGGSGIRMIKGYGGVGEAYGVSKKTVAIDEQFSSTKGGNPAKTAYLTLYSQAMDESTSVTVRAHVDLTFYVQWKGLLNVGGS